MGEEHIQFNEEKLNSEVEKKIERQEQFIEIFDNIYEQLKPRPGVDLEKAGKNFIDSLSQYQDIHIGKIDRDESVTQSIERIWTQGIAINLEHYHGDAKKFEKQKAFYSQLYLKFKGHIDRLVQVGEVEPFTAKVFLENLRALKASDFYNDIIRNPERPSDLARKKYSDAARKLYEMYDETRIFENDGFYHFNRIGNEDAEIKNRIYLSADLSGSPEQLVDSWRMALVETGLQDKIYFKLTGHLSQRYETIVIYQTDDLSDEEIGRLIETFQKFCPQAALAKRNMPSCVPISRGISYAPEPKNLNELFQAMDLRETEYSDAPIRVSYNQMIAGFVRLSFELAYNDFTALSEKKPYPKNLKDGAKKYFEQMLRLAGINPETMVPNSQGGVLPTWIKNSHEKLLG